MTMVDDAEQWITCTWPSHVHFVSCNSSAVVSPDKILTQRVKKITMESSNIKFDMTKFPMLEILTTK